VQVDAVAADLGVAPNPGLVLRVVVEDHGADAIAARLEAGPLVVLLGNEDIAEQGPGNLAPASAYRRKRELTVLESHLPAELIEVACEVRRARLRGISTDYKLCLEGLA
jgi:hypothetical protein